MENQSIELTNIYEDILSGKIKAWPAYTWNPLKGGHDNFRRAIRYLAYEKLHMSRENILKINIPFFKKWKLATGWRSFNGIYNALNYAFPELELREWEMDVVPSGFWEDERNIARAIRWLVLERLRWDRETTINSITNEVLEANKFASLANRHGAYKLLQIALPEWDVKAWELNATPQGFWNEREIKNSIRWLVLEKFKWTKQETIEKFNVEALWKNKLSSLTRYKTIYDLINDAIPEWDIKPWQLSAAPRNYWNDKNNIKTAIRHIVLEELKWDRAKTIANINIEVLKQFNINAILFDYTLWEILQISFPEWNLKLEELPNKKFYINKSRGSI